MENIKIYENPEFGKVRTTQINGEPYFVGKDVTEILGYSNNRKALSDHVDDEDKGVTKCDTLGGTQEMTVINESGLYSLILSSKLPKAKEFKRWVTSDVLPSIRKTGSYGTPKMSVMEMIAQLAENAVKTEKTLAEHTERINDLEEKTDANIQGIVREALTYATLTFEQQKYIQVKVALKIFDLCPEYNDYKANKERLFNKIYNDIRKRYKVSSFRNVRARDFEDTLKFIDSWTVKKS